MSDHKVRKVIDAERIVLRDRSGAERAVLEVGDEDSSVTLTLFDHLGRARMELGIFEGEPRVALVDQEGIVRAEVGVHPDTDAPSVLLRGEGGVERLRMAVAAGGGAVVSVFGSRGQVSAGLLVDRADQPSIGLVDQNDVTRLQMTVGDTQTAKGIGARVDLFDGKGDAALTLMSTGDGDAVVRLVRDDHPVVGLAASHGMKGLSIRDQNGVTQAELYLDQEGKLHAHFNQEGAEEDLPVA